MNCPLSIVLVEIIMLFNSSAENAVITFCLSVQVKVVSCCWRLKKG